MIRLVSTNDNLVAEAAKYTEHRQAQETNIHVLSENRTRDPKRLQTCTIDLAVTGIDTYLDYTFKRFETGVWYRLFDYIRAVN